MDFTDIIKICDIINKIRILDMLQFEMMGNHEERKVDNYKGPDCEGNNFILDTCAVTDSLKPFETALLHPLYNNNLWIILESYDTKEDAQNGHNKWANQFINVNLPDILIDRIVAGFEDILKDQYIKIQRK